MERRVEEFTIEGKNFIYIDFSNLKMNDEVKELIEVVKGRISKYAEHSLLTITNVKDVKYDSDVKAIISDYMEHNKFYVKCGAVIGFDGIKKIMINAIFRLCGRKNMTFVSSKELAIKFLLSA